MELPVVATPTPTSTSTPTSTITATIMQNDNQTFSSNANGIPSRGNYPDEDDEDDLLQQNGNSLSLQSGWDHDSDYRINNTYHYRSHSPRSSRTRRYSLLCLVLLALLLVILRHKNGLRNNNNNNNTLGDTSTIPENCFASHAALKEAIQIMLNPESAGATPDAAAAEAAADAAIPLWTDEQSQIMARYGWPMGTWCVDYVTNFSELFMGLHDKCIPEDPHNKYGYGQGQGFEDSNSGWNVARATSMARMFESCTAPTSSLASKDTSAFLKSLGIENWDVSNVEDMTAMFHHATTMDNIDLGRWKVHKVKSMALMFRSAISYTGETGRSLQDWDTSAVTDMKEMFLEATSFQGDVSGWDVSRVTSMESMFHGATSFDGDLGSWDTSNVQNMKALFLGAVSFTGTGRGLSQWNVQRVTHMDGMFHLATSFNPSIVSSLKDWKTDSLVSTKMMFANATSFAPSTTTELASWDMSKVTDMSLMFYGATQFVHGGLSNWDVSAVTDLSFCFAGATHFNDDLSTWTTTRVTTMQSLFQDVTAFDQDLSLWDISQTTNTQDMFAGASSFTGKRSTAGGETRVLDSWDLSAVSADNSNYYVSPTTAGSGLDSPMAGGSGSGSGNDEDPEPFPTRPTHNMHGMFRQAHAFTGESLSAWNTSGVFYFNHVFHDATSFVGDLSPWDVSGVADMSSFLEGANTFFTSPNSHTTFVDWDLSEVVKMNRMLYSENTNSWDRSKLCDNPILKARWNEIETKDLFGPGDSDCGYTV